MAVMDGVVSRAERTGAALAGGAVLLVGGSVAASSLLAGYPVLGGQAVRYAAAGLVLAGWARLRGQPLPRPVGREWSWLVGLAAVGLAGCSVLLIEATRVADPAAVGVVIGAAPVLIALAGPIAAGRRPAGRALVAAAVVAAGAAATQVDGGTGRSWTVAGLLLSLGALAGVAGTTVLAAPVLPRLGALAVSVYACGLAGAQLLAAAALVRLAGGPPVLVPPTATELAALTYLAIAVTAVVFLAWYAALERLGVARTGLFNGLIPVASLAAVAAVGTGAVTRTLVFGAVAVLAGLLFGLTGPADRADRPGLATTARRRDLVLSATGASCAGAGEGHEEGPPISTHLEPERSQAKFVEAAATAIDRPPQPSPRLRSARRPSAT
jgi:drug/metabolite transporter (DMT)-like permease